MKQVQAQTNTPKKFASPLPGVSIVIPVVDWSEYRKAIGGIVEDLGWNKTEQLLVNVKTANSKGGSL